MSTLRCRPGSCSVSQDVFVTAQHLAIVTSYANGGDLATLIGRRIEHGVRCLLDLCLLRPALVSDWLTEAFSNVAHACMAPVSSTGLSVVANPCGQFDGCGGAWCSLLMGHENSTMVS